MKLVMNTRTNSDLCWTWHSGLAFFANRLDTSDDSIVMSQPGDYFNFFANSALAVGDSDPIDLTASASKPAFLKSAISTPKGLLLFSENHQFLMRSDEVAFAPATVKLTEPMATTKGLLILSVQVSVLSLHLNQTHTLSCLKCLLTLLRQTSHSRDPKAVPEFVPQSLTWASSSPNNSIVYFGDDSSTVYIFKFYNQGNERQVAGWAKWEFPSQVRMWGADDGFNYIVTYDGTNSILLKMELLDETTAPITTTFTQFLPRLDHIMKKADLTTSVVGSDTRINFLDGSYVANTQPVFIVTSGSNQSVFLRPTIQRLTTKYIDIPTGLTGADYMIGLQYGMTVALPSFYVSEQDKSQRIHIQ